ncbi:KAT8 regulatory NSL complex subunit 1 isoform X2 [Trichogramma pretiosum]|uniref:KAT8 regulatory NSL complex subunit 1 isoform X2 n=1 Tax=Trichogramma pretiosum TaxID=7493 RepID=UPI000C71B845|nr:KAT8 regulatory NSL complex subunit 1 isoform X2 [Trichogramma pretiosum]
MGVSPAELWTVRLRQQERTRRRNSCNSVVAGQSPWLDVEPSALATSVAVMAPALTEAGPQKPENLIPALPAGGFLTAEQAKQVCLSASVHLPKSSNVNNKPKICQDHEVLAQFVVSANVQPTKIDDQCLHGIPKDLINDVINLKFSSGLDSLSDLIINKKDSLAVAAEETEVGDEYRDAIMSDQSMDDQANNMCFFKSIPYPTGTPEEEQESRNISTDSMTAAASSTLNVQEKQNDVDEDGLEQIMGFAQTVDLGHNVDDILQVIKSMEENDAGAEENRLTSEGLVGGVSSQSAEGVPEIFQDSEPFSLNLLSDVDVIGLCSEQLTDQSISVPSSSSLHHIEQQHDPMLLQQQQESARLNAVSQQQTVVEKRQHELERRASFLARRLRKIQSRLVAEHAAEQTGNVLQLAQQSAKKNLIDDLSNLGSKAGVNRNFPELSGSLSSFLNKLQKSCSAQSNSIAVRQRNTCRYFGAGSKDFNGPQQPLGRGTVFGMTQIKLDGKELENVCGPLTSKIKVLQSAYDSECTASSSDCDSCDELQTFNNPHQQHLPVSKRAAWRFAQERAALASRWTWLQAQISELEYKIRHTYEIQKQMRLAKGPVVLEAASPPPLQSRVSPMTSYDDIASTITSTTTSMVNGFSNLVPNNSPATPGLNSIGASSSGAARTRPLVRSQFRKRKLVRIEGLHEILPKVARPSTIKCHCDGTKSSCIICTGRCEPMAGHAHDTMSVQERIATLDACHHPVLTLRDEVTQSVHFDAVMRSNEWQQKIMRGGMRVSKVKDKDTTERKTKKVSERPKYPASRVRKSTTSLCSEKIKKKVLNSTRTRNNKSGTTRKRPSAKQQQSQQHQLQSQLQQQPGSALPTPLHTDEDEVGSVLSYSSKYSSPVASPYNAAISTHAPDKTTFKERSSSNSHKIRQNSFDIDNIVIPYSVAAATRLEKLPYKEILIPRWRRCDTEESDVKNGTVQKSNVDKDVEDISEETIRLRHDRSEREETSRFNNSKHLPSYGRRKSRRTDSNKPDSGANTPDVAMSPRPASENEATSPAPQPNNHPIEIIAPLVPPYEPRRFPLSDADYQQLLAETDTTVRSIPNEIPEIASASPKDDKIELLETEADRESDSTESALCDMEGEDPNDPEWTVAEEKETEKDRIRPTAKR